MEKLVLNIRTQWQNWYIVFIFAIIKLLIHLLTNTNYDFHRDEYLHLALGEHLAWGFMEVPPVIAILSKIALDLGGNLFIVRLFPALIGSITIILIGVMVRDLGGKHWAQILACLAFIISPVFLRSNTLFHPVSFNQFCWFLSAFFIVRLIKSENPNYWYYIGFIAGLGFLTKYTIVFFYAAFLLAIFLTPHRKWLKTKYPYLALGIALFISLPNLLWQFHHNLPVVQHMSELSQTQLKNVESVGFLVAQLSMHHAASIIWLSGLFYLFFFRKLVLYRILGWIYLGILLLLVLLSGKSYYALDAYPMLMAVGGIAVENFLQNKSGSLKYVLICLLFIVTIPILPYGLPLVSVKKMQHYCAFMKDRFSLYGPLYWEDGKVHSLPQDYADMHGWEEMAAKVGQLYHRLSAFEQKSCILYGGSYSHASSINYYREKYKLPEVYSLVGSYLTWAPDSVQFDRMIMVDDVYHSRLPQFASMALIDSIQNPYAREPGYIYYLTKPHMNVGREWTKLVVERKKAHNF
jgi:hypothetical protein